MTVGHVEEQGGGLYAYVDVVVRGPTGREVLVSALVDTGFNAYVSLPRNVVIDLGLVRLGTDDVTLANADIDAAELYLAEVHWRQSRRNLPVHQIGDEPTIGTALLRSYNLSVDFVPDGDVQVHPIA